MGSTITELDIELEMKISRIKHLENKNISRKTDFMNEYYDWI